MAHAAFMMMLIIFVMIVVSRADGFKVDLYCTCCHAICWPLPDDFRSTDVG